MLGSRPTSPHHPRARRAALLGAIVALVSPLPAATVAPADRVDFNFQIRPLLSDRCYRCHGPDAGSRKADLRLDLPEGLHKDLGSGWWVTKPGDPARSELIQRIYSDDREEMMPRPDSHLSLTADEKALLRRWVEQGAEIQPHWALLPVSAPATPRLGRGENLVDGFVRARLAKERLSPAPEAARDAQIRRLALTLTGLPPTPAEIDAFAADRSQGAYAKIVDRYLASPAYGERMAQDWLDLARFSDTYGYQMDVERDVSAWRDWVIGAFNRNLRYDDFLRWQLAGDLLPSATHEQRLATAFNRLHRQTNEGGSIDEEFRADYVADRVNTFGSAMLGLTVSCARCHDHKFDPVTQRDYYSLFAFFNSIDESGLYSHFTKATPTPTLPLWRAGEEDRHRQLLARIAAEEGRLAARAKAATADFARWTGGDAVLQPRAPVAEFSFDALAEDATASVDGRLKFKLKDGPELVAGREDQALRFNGDNTATAEGVGDFSRTDPFSFNVWLHPSQPRPREVVLHHSRAWSDSGSRGYELLLEDGRPAFALIHFWPGNAVAVRAHGVIPAGEWSLLTVTYDGSSRAAGIRLYRNGAPLEVEVVRDRLTKDIRHRAEWGDSEVGKIPLTLAGRFRDSGFKDGMIDRLQVYDACLTPAEVATLAGTPARPALEDYLAQADPEYRAVAAALRGLRDEENRLFNDVPEIMVMEELPQPRTTHLLKRGAYDAPGEVVQPDTPSAILPFPAGAPRNRLGLAQWLTDRRHPLTARVVVNRIWRMHFGRGLVATPDDFGSQGGLPSHPQLLDALAAWFMDHDWDVKALHRLIVTSATYRQSSRADAALLARDPDNVLLARGPSWRLPAEQVRDGALAASGLLVRKIGGPSVKPYQPAGLWEQSGTGKTYVQDHGDALYRRSLYTFWRRTSPPPSMLAFDAVTREVCTAKREVTATPLQSLVLLNDPQFIEAARVLASRLLQLHPNDPAACIREACRALLGRAPDAVELDILRRLLAGQRELYAADPAAAARLLAVGETAPPADQPAVDLAALTTVVSAVINFDEFVVLR